MIKAAVEAVWIYVELTKPRISFLVLMTVLLGYYLGLESQAHINASFSLSLCLHLLTGSLLASAGVSALNGYIERDLDRSMKRTAGRPLPSGRITPQAAKYFGLIISTLGVLELALLVNWLTGLLALLTITIYLAIYTPLKRVTSWNTVIGAVLGALPPVGGWVAAQGVVSLEAMALFGILFCWQIPHFLALAIMYRNDYARGGYAMMTVVHPIGYTNLHLILFSLALVGTTIALFVVSHLGLIYLGGATLLGLMMLWISLVVTKAPTPRTARKLLLASVFYLPALLLLIVIDRVWA